MQRNHAKIGSTTNVLALNKNHPNNIKPQFNIADVNVENDVEYKIRWERVIPGGNEVLGETIQKVYENNYSVTIPARIVTENDLQPGIRVKAVVYDVLHQSDKDDTEYKRREDMVDRTTPVGDSTASDGLDSRLSSEAIWDYLGNEEKPVTYRNVTNGKEETVLIERNENRFEIPFHKSVREAIDASKNSMIEIIPHEEVDNEEVDNHIGNKEIPTEKIDEIHSMVSELHDAYTEARDD